MKASIKITQRKDFITKMDISMGICYLRKRRGTTEARSMRECAKITREAGFRYIDFSGNYYIANDNWRETTEQVLKDFSDFGLTVDQTHAPYVYSGIEENVYREHMRRSFELAHMLGAKHIVIHADKYTPDADGFDFDKALTAVYDFYAPYVEYAKKAGLGVAIENLFDNKHGPRTRFTSLVEEQIAIIDKFADPIVSACWDFGHGKCSYGKDHLEAMRKLGQRLTSTHVHDNHWDIDMHQNIYFGDCDWEKAVAYLKEMSYNGKFTYELVYGVLPDALIGRYMKLFYDTADYLVNGSSGLPQHQ